jgi:hypothetical protein
LAPSDHSPDAVSILDEFGVYFVSFTHITLKSKLSDVSGYNALNPDGSASFLDAIRRVVDADPPPDWKG